MKKYNMDTMFGETLKDERVKQILSQNFPMVLNNPRISEAYEYTLNEILTDDMGAIVGIPKSAVKKVLQQIMQLD